jgi:ubiquinone/menaquinone biosynthesis C-methylase UbiE
MNENVSLITSLHTQTKRNYISRVTDFQKGHCAEIARKFGKEYWDGERQFGYGGYHYDGRWKPVAEKMIKHYRLSHQSKILDVGCGKGFLLYEIKKQLPGAFVQGVDISTYAIENAKEEIKPFLKIGNAAHLDFDNQEFDFVFSITTLHNLYLFDLFSALKEIQRVTRGDSFHCVESYRNEQEKVNLIYWQLTCEAFFKPEEWAWIYKECNYTGDFEYIFFE